MERGKLTDDSCGETPPVAFSDRPAGRTESALSDDLLDATIADIRAAQVEHGLALAVEIGRIVVERFYGGDLGNLRDRRQKDVSLRKLAQHPALPISAASLYNAIGIYSITQRLGVHTCKQLSPSHIRAVLQLREAEQDAVLLRAALERWTVERLIAEVRKVAETTARSGGGRPPLPPFVKSIHALERYVGSADELFGGLDSVTNLGADEAHSLYLTVTGLKQKCEELQNALRPKVEAEVGQSPSNEGAMKARR